MIIYHFCDLTLIILLGSTGPFEFSWLTGCLQPSYYHHQINQRYPPFPLLSYLAVVVCLMWLYHDILSSVGHISREHLEVVSIIDVQSIVCLNDRVHLIIIIMQTYLKTLNFYNACQICAVACASKMKLSKFAESQLSQLTFVEYIGPCFFNLVNRDDQGNVYFILLWSSSHQYESLTIV